MTGAKRRKSLRMKTTFERISETSMNEICAFVVAVIDRVSCGHFPQYAASTDRPGQEECETLGAADGGAGYACCGTNGRARCVLKISASMHRKA